MFSFKMNPGVYHDGQNDRHLLVNLDSPKKLHFAIENDFHNNSEILNSPHFESSHIDTIVDKGNSNLLIDVLSDPKYENQINSKHISKILRDHDRGKLVKRVAAGHSSFGDEHMNFLMSHPNHELRNIGINSKFFNEKFVDKGLLDPVPYNRIDVASSPYINKSHIKKLLNDKSYFVASIGLNHPEFRMEHLRHALYNRHPQIRLDAMSHRLFQANKHKYKEYLDDMSNHPILSMKAKEILKDIKD